MDSYSFARWIVRLLEGSFIPSKPIRELRNLTRYRKSIIEEISSQKNRIEKHLQSCGFKLSTFLTDIFGVSGRAIMEHLSYHGKISAREVENFVKGRAKSKLHEIKQAVNGKVDTDAYRKENDNRAVKKTLTIPNWLNIKAEKANINFSQVLQKALIKRIKLDSR